MTGPVNLASPQAATAGDISRAVARNLHRRHWLPAPGWALRLVLGDAATDLLLADQHVLPQRLIEEGTFHFADTDLDSAVAVAIQAGK